MTANNIQPAAELPPSLRRAPERCFQHSPRSGEPPAHLPAAGSRAFPAATGRFVQ